MTQHHTPSTSLPPPQHSHHHFSCSHALTAPRAPNTQPMLATITHPSASSSTSPTCNHRCPQPFATSKRLFSVCCLRDAVGLCAPCERHQRPPCKWQSCRLSASSGRPPGDTEGCWMWRRPDQQPKEYLLLPFACQSVTALSRRGASVGIS